MTRMLVLLASRKGMALWFEGPNRGGRGWIITTEGPERLSRDIHVEQGYRLDVAERRMFKHLMTLPNWSKVKADARR